MNLSTNTTPVQTITIKNAAKGCKAELYTSMDAFCVRLIRSKRVKNPVCYRFKVAANRANYVSAWINDQIKAEQSRVERKNNQVKLQTNVKLGDVFRSSWGYDQTNVDYYQVTKLIGKTMVEIREIAQDRFDTTSMSGKCIPVADDFISEPIRKKFNGNYIKISSCQFAYLEDHEVVAGCKIYKGTHFSTYA
jgi:hypothetical protein